MSSEIKVMLADDHQIVIDGMQLFLDHEDDIVVVATALDGFEVLELLKSNTIDILVLDLSMPRMDGLETLKQLRALYPALKTVILSFSLEGDKIHAAIEAGAQAYVVKNRGGQDLVKAIRAVAAGDVYFPEDIMKVYSQFIAQRAANPANAGTSNAAPSAREAEVMACILDGMTTKEMADVLCIAPTTVETHKKHLREKFALLNNAQISSLAERLGVVPWSARAKKRQ